MKLEAGKRYIRKDGKLTGPLELDDESPFPFFDPKFCETYTVRGKFTLSGPEGPFDLFAEHIEEAVKDEGGPAFPETKHTPGPWKVGEGSFVTASHPIPEVGGSDAVDYYGGHLVAESIARQNLAIIAAAPDLLEALKSYLSNYSDSDLVILSAATSGLGEIGPDTAKREIIARAAIAKATGKEQP